VAENETKRCRWCLATEHYIHYHDTEWGFPVDDDFRLFEKLSLESFQSGLSWLTILNKRESFREAFKQFDFYKIARFNDKNIERLMNNAGIVRHRGKIEATINNAKIAKQIVKQEGTLATFIWRFEPASLLAPKNLETIPAKTQESIALAKELKKRGWKFFGPTTAYAFMQSMGLVNDHIADCHIRPKVEQARARFKRP
jgi:DNA-3-methyladenine glycosylase I